MYLLSATFDRKCGALSAVLQSTAFACFNWPRLSRETLLSYWRIDAAIPFHGAASPIPQKDTVLYNFTNSLEPRLKSRRARSGLASTLVYTCLKTEHLLHPTDCYHDVGDRGYISPCMMGKTHENSRQDRDVFIHHQLLTIYREAYVTFVHTLRSL